MKKFKKLLTVSWESGILIELSQRIDSFEHTI